MKCNCGEKSTGWTTIACCNICGHPISTEQWEFNNELTQEEIEACKIVGIEVAQYWACINPFMGNELVALFNNKIYAEQFRRGLQTLKVIPYAMQIGGKK